MHDIFHVQGLQLMTERRIHMDWNSIIWMNIKGVLAASIFSILVLHVCRQVMWLDSSEQWVANDWTGTTGLCLSKLQINCLRHLQSLSLVSHDININGWYKPLLGNVLHFGWLARTRRHQLLMSICLLIIVNLELQSY